MALLFSRSTSVLVLLPLLIISALTVTTQLTLRTLVLVLVLTALLSLFLAMFLQLFYAERLAGASAERSARHAFGIGFWVVYHRSGKAKSLASALAKNGQVSRRAYDVGRALGASIW